MSLRNLLGGAATQPEGATPELSELEKTFADLSARTARGEKIGQGELDDKLNPIQQIMLKHDADGSGSFDIGEVEAIVHEFEEEKKRLKEGEPKTEIEQRFYDLSSRMLKGETIGQAELDEKLNPVQQVMLKHDADGSGSFSLREVEAIVEDFEAEKQKVKSMGKVIMALLVIIMLALASIFAVSIGGALIANEKSKESHVEGGEMTAAGSGDPVTVSVTESLASIYDLGNVAINDLKYFETFSAYVDMGADAAVGDWAEAHVKISQVYKSVDPAAYDVVFLESTDGDVIKVNSTAREATMTTAAGAVFAVAEELPDARRRLVEDDVTKNEDKLNVVHPVAKGEYLPKKMQRAGRRLGRRGAFLSTSGSFQISGAGRGNRAGND